MYFFKAPHAVLNMGLPILLKVITQSNNCRVGRTAGIAVSRRARARRQQPHHPPASRSTRKTFPIIGVGGVMSGADAVSTISAGACVGQICTGLIYKGPELVREAAISIKKSR